jgi:hypothetical protein
MSSMGTVTMKNYIRTVLRLTLLTAAIHILLHNRNLDGILELLEIKAL